MKLIRWGQPGNEQPGIYLNQVRYDLSRYIRDYDREFFRNQGLIRIQELVEKGILTESLALPKDTRWGPPVARPGKIVCVGLNYREHAQESGSPIPQEPVLFMKATTAYTGPYDPIWIPHKSTHTDYEVELAIVIGQDAYYLSSEAEAKEKIAGWILANDVSERDYQRNRGGQWCKGKSADSFFPVGPYLVTSDEIENIHQIELKLKVNGELRQNGKTSDMIFTPYFLVYYISQFMRLEPGDIISTGTPSGVGMGMNPPQYLRPGDVVELSGTGLGEQHHICQRWGESPFSS